MAVETDRPLDTVVTLLAAELVCAVPVLAARSWSPAARQRVLELVPGLGDRFPGAAGEGGLLVVVTSGSSGSPRAVVRTASSWTRSLTGFDTLLGGQCPAGAVVLVPGDAASTLTLFGVWHALATGRPVLAPGPWHGPASAPAGAGATAVQCVPAVLADVLTARRSGALPALARAVVAGAAFPAAARRAAEATGIAVSEYYGAAELSFVAADGDGAGLRAFPGVEVDLRDGVIWSRSPYRALGYLDVAAGGPLRVDADGWASVGDRGRLSADGVLAVRGRGDDAASVGGHVVVLDDVERVLAAVPGAAEVVCLAEPDPRLGERVLCVVRPVPEVLTERDGAALVARLRAAARDALPPPARPVRVVLRAELPRTPGGKVARAALRKAVARR